MAGPTKKGRGQKTVTDANETPVKRPGWSRLFFVLLIVWGRLRKRQSIEKEASRRRDE